MNAHDSMPIHYVNIRRKDSLIISHSETNYITEERIGLSGPDCYVYIRASSGKDAIRNALSVFSSMKYTHPGVWHFLKRL